MANELEHPVLPHLIIKQKQTLGSIFCLVCGQLKRILLPH